MTHSTTKLAAVALSLTLGQWGLVALGSGRALAQSAAKGASKTEDIRKLMQLSGAGDLGAQMAKQMIPALKQAAPGVPEAFWSQFAAKIKGDDLVDLIVPIYEKHLTADEVKQLITFYQSPVGKKMVQVQPQIVQESMDAGRQWGIKLAEEAMREIHEKGYGAGKEKGQSKDKSAEGE